MKCLDCPTEISITRHPCGKLNTKLRCAPCRANAEQKRRLKIASTHRTKASRLARTRLFECVGCGEIFVQRRLKSTRKFSQGKCCKTCCAAGRGRRTGKGYRIEDGSEPLALGPVVWTGIIDHWMRG